MTVAAPSPLPALRPRHLWDTHAGARPGRAGRPEGVTRALAEHARRGRARDPLRALTARQREVVLLAVAGATNDEIAGCLFVTRRTVESHLTGAFRALGLSRRAQLAALVARVALGPVVEPIGGHAAGRTT